MSSDNQIPVISIVNINSLQDIDEDTRYLAYAYQYLYGSCGYFYVIELFKQSDTNTIYRNKVTEGAVFDKLESIRNKYESTNSHTNLTRFGIVRRVIMDISYVIVEEHNSRTLLL